MIIPTRYTPLPKHVFISLCCEMLIKEPIIILYQYKFPVVKLQQFSRVTLGSRQARLCLKQRFWSKEITDQKGKV